MYFILNFFPFLHCSQRLRLYLDFIFQFGERFHVHRHLFKTPFSLYYISYLSHSCTTIKIYITVYIARTITPCSQVPDYVYIRPIDFTFNKSCTKYDIICVLLYIVPTTPYSRLTEQLCVVYQV